MKVSRLGMMFVLERKEGVRSLAWGIQLAPCVGELVVQLLELGFALENS